MPDAWKATRFGVVTAAQWPEVAKELLRLGRGYTIWLFFGDMGSGKTTLIKHLVKELGLQDAVVSPTYSIVNMYGNPDENPVYHFDFYRLKSELEALDLGFEEYLTSGHLCLIEWPEKVKSLLPEAVFEVNIQYRDAMSRELYYRRHE